MEKYYLGCSCTMQKAFKKQLYHIIALNLEAMDTDEKIHEAYKKTYEFINLWCPVQKDCPCKEKEE